MLNADAAELIHAMPADWKNAVEHVEPPEPLLPASAERDAARIDEKEESRTRALVQSRGGGLQPKTQDLSESGSAAAEEPFRMAWISAAMGSALHSCMPSLALRGEQR